MKKQHRILSLSFIALTVLFAVSCLKDDDSEKREKEKRLIENYVQTNNISVTPTASGLYFIPQVEGTGATSTGNDYVIIEYKATDLDGKFFDGTSKVLAEQAKVYPYFALGGPLKILTSQYGFLKGVTEGLKMMKEGGKARMIMPSLLAYNDYVPRIIDVELIKVIPNPMAYEKSQIANFIDTASNLTMADSTSSGVFHIERLAGTGTLKPFNGKRVKIRYKGYLPDGRVFDKTPADTVFKFRVGNQEVISGLDEGIRLMTKGGKSTMVIPYYRGYGFNQVTSRGQVVIPWFSTLVFDIELLDVMD